MMHIKNTNCYNSFIKIIIKTTLSSNQPPWMYVFLFAIWNIWLRAFLLRLQICTQQLPLNKSFFFFSILMEYVFFKLDVKIQYLQYLQFLTRIIRNSVVFKNYSNHNNLATQILIKSLQYAHCALAPKPPARITQQLITDGSAYLGPCWRWRIREG